MDVLNTANIAEVLRVLRVRLRPVEAALSQGEGIEGLESDVRRAAVLIPIFESHGETYLAFIRRAMTLRSDGGEIEFHGGRCVHGESFRVTRALSEAQLGIGIDAASLVGWGMVSAVFTVVCYYIITP